MEREWLPRLAPYLPTRIPEVLGAGEPAQGYPWPWSVYRWLAGEHPEAGALSEPVLLAGDLAASVAASDRLRLAARLLGPGGEVVTDGQGVRVLGAEHPLGDG
jgi:aminoglycoside phosphotransferase (APT) family kinase protein